MEQVSLVFKGMPVEEDSVFLAEVIRSATWGWTVQPLQRLIYDELNNTGRFVIVRNIELRNSITELYNTFHVMQDVALKRTGDYARIAYALVPRESESRLKRDLTSLELEVLVDAVLNSNLDENLVFEQNRTLFLKSVWNSLGKSCEQVNAKIEAELNN